MRDVSSMSSSQRTFGLLALQSYNIHPKEVNMYVCTFSDHLQANTV